MSFVLFCFGVTYRKSLRDERYSVLRTMGSLWLSIADLKLMNVPSIPALQGPRRYFQKIWVSGLLMSLKCCLDL